MRFLLSLFLVLLSVYLHPATVYATPTRLISPASSAAKPNSEASKSSKIEAAKIAYPACSQDCAKIKKDVTDYEEKCARLCTEGVFDNFPGPTQSSLPVEAANSASPVKQP
jgi:hypothetical protein